MWSLKMIYRIVTYSRDDERMRGSLAIPEGWVAWAKGAAGVQPDDDGLGDYPLNEEQTRVFAQQFGFRPEPERFFYYLEPYEPPEDTGFEPARAA
jgi:hypothetical protein